MPLALFSLFLLCLFGTGLWLFPRGKIEAWQGFIAGVAGVGVSHLLVYAGMPVRETFLPLTVVGGVGLLRALPRSGGFSVDKAWRVVGLLPLALYIGWRIIGEPLSHWDARSIWFFHGKILYYDQLFLPAHWQKVELHFAHPDYPKLVPLLAAQAATVAGYWNDYLPKAALAVLLILFQMGMYALPVGNLVLWVLSAVLLRGMWEGLWIGYMDGYLALFAFLAAANAGLFTVRGEKRYLWSTIGSLAVMLQIKNEGAIAALVLGAALLAVLAWRRQLSRRFEALDLRQAVLFSPAVAWLLFKSAHGLTNYFERHFRWELVGEHLGSGMFWKGFAEHYLLRAPLAGALPALLVFLLIGGGGRRRRWDWETAAPALMGFVAYSGFILFAFLSSPLDFPGHFEVAMGRLCGVPAYLCLAAGACLALDVRARG